MNLTTASVRVMKSYDYSHFEIALSSNDATTLEEVDSLRKAAARLADKAVAQYKIAKANIEAAANDASRLESLQYQHLEILEKPESERTPEEKAVVKAMENREHWKRKRYDYEDDFEEQDFEDESEELLF